MSLIPVFMTRSLGGSSCCRVLAREPNSPGDIVTEPLAPGLLEYSRPLPARRLLRGTNSSTESPRTWNLPSVSGERRGGSARIGVAPAFSATLAAAGSSGGQVLARRPAAPFRRHDGYPGHQD